jgi:hypothetical protein
MRSDNIKVIRQNVYVDEGAVKMIGMLHGDEDHCSIPKRRMKMGKL